MNLLSGIGCRTSLLAGALLAGLAGCGDAEPPRSVADTTGTGPGPGQKWFVEMAAESGLDFRHVNGMTGQLHMPEMMGSGVALLDYDNDGDLDVFLSQGGSMGAVDGAVRPADRLFRNELSFDGVGRPSLRFSDATAESRIDSRGYGMGVATGDVDNDGWIDLYLLNLGPNRLFRNRGDGTFTDVTARYAVGDPGWGVAGTFFDYDRDGWLDLFLGNYLIFSLATHKTCLRGDGRADYCGPQAYPPQPNRLYRNLGGRGFQDVTDSSGIGTAFGGALGVVAEDFDDDGWPDLYVANDERPNLLWLNQGDGAFLEQGMLSGTSVNSEGLEESSMGVDAADFDGDGDMDLFMSHLRQQTNTLYRNDGGGFFQDASRRTGLALPSLPYTGFGTGFFDLDNDGWLDLAVANGAVRILPELEAAGDPHPLGQPNKLFRNLGDGRFQDVTEHAGRVFAATETSRGLAFGDIDNDGDTDLVMTNNNGPARLFLNQAGNRNHWIGLRFTQRNPGRDALGARVAVYPEGESARWRRVHTDGSYLASHDPRVLVGLGGATRIDRVEAVWPDGSRERWVGLAADRYHHLAQGSGTPLKGG